MGEDPLWKSGPGPSAAGGLVIALQPPIGRASGPGHFSWLLGARELVRIDPDGSVFVLGEKVATRPELFDLLASWAQSHAAPSGDPPIVGDKGDAGPSGA